MELPLRLSEDWLSSTGEIVSVEDVDEDEQPDEADGGVPLDNRAAWWDR